MMSKRLLKARSKLLFVGFFFGICNAASAQTVVAPKPATQVRAASAPVAPAAAVGTVSQTIAVQPQLNNLEVNLIEASDLNELTTALFAGVQNFVAKRRSSPSCINNPACQKKLTDLENAERAEIFNRNGEVYQKISVLLKKEFSPAEMDWLLKVYQQPLAKRFRKFIYSPPVTAMLADFPKSVTKKMNAIAPLNSPASYAPASGHRGVIPVPPAQTVPPAVKK